MPIEDDMFNAFKYAGFGKRIDPTQMIRALLRNFEVVMLTQMETQIRTRLSQLQFEHSPMDDTMNPYSILGVDMNATEEEVERAYKEKAKLFHPDKGGSDMEMAKINAAYQVIKQFKGWH